MPGTVGFLKDLALLLAAAAIVGLSLWERVRRRTQLSALVPFVFALIFGLFLLIFARTLSGIHRLEHMDDNNVSSISFRGKTCRDRQQIHNIVRALRDSRWWSARSADIIEPEPFSIRFADGSEWDMVIGANRYGSGIVLRMADEHELSRGHAWSPALDEALKHY